MTKPNTAPLDAASQQAQQQQQLANKMGGNFSDIMGQMLGKQQGAIDQYGPLMQQFMSQLQGEQGNLASAANAQVNPLLANAKQLSEGLSPEALAALKGQAIDQNTGFDQAMSQQMAAMGARGFGGQGGMGNLEAQLGGLYGQREQAKAGALRNITMQNENLRNQNIMANNQFNLANLQGGLQSKNLTLQGLASALQAGSSLYGQQGNTLSTLLSAYNPTGYGQLAEGALGLGNQSVSQQLQAGQTIAQLPSFWNNLMTAGLGAAGTAAGGWFSNPSH